MHKSIEDIKTREEARQEAIEIQNWISQNSLSYSGLCDYQEYFRVLGEKFNLIDEFKENGLI